MCKLIGVHYSSKCKVYDKEGVMQQEDDMVMLRDNDILYVAPQGTSVLFLTSIQESSSTILHF